MPLHDPHRLTTDSMRDRLVADGHRPADVTAAMDSFTNADSRDLDDIGWGLGEYQVLADQLASSGGAA